MANFLHFCRSASSAEYFHYTWLGDTCWVTLTPLVTNHCPTCSRSSDSERGVRVHHAVTHDERLPNRECHGCGDQFYSETRRQYCSDECRERNVSFAGEQNPNYRGDPPRRRATTAVKRSSPALPRNRATTAASVWRTNPDDTHRTRPVRTTTGGPAASAPSTATSAARPSVAIRAS